MLKRLKVYTWNVETLLTRFGFQTNVWWAICVSKTVVHVFNEQHAPQTNVHVFNVGSCKLALTPLTIVVVSTSAPAAWQHRHDTACARKGPLQQGLSQNGYGIGISWAR